MISWLVNDTIVYGSFLLCALLWFMASYFIWKSDGKNHSLRRSLFLLIGISGILLLILRPYHQSIENSKSVGIITSSTVLQPDTLDALFTSVHDFKNDPISSQTSDVHLIGDGLPIDDLNLISDYQLHYHPGPMQSGIVDLTIPKITEKQPWVLEGAYQGDVRSIQMKGPAGEVIDALLRDSTFVIESTAGNAGQYLYEFITTTSTSDTIVDHLSIHIDDQAQWNLLTLSSYPSFELNYLKNYWTSLGYGFAQRTKIAQDKYQTAFVNMDKLNLESISSANLQKFDFLLCDIAYWNGLNKSERSRIRSKVYNEGLSLILKPQNGDLKAQDISHPLIAPSQPIELGSGQEAVQLNQHSLTPRSGWEPVNIENVNIALYRNQGLGHIMILGVDLTYLFILNDESELYQDLWATLFSAMYRDFSLMSQLLHEQWIWAGEPTDLQIITHQTLDQRPTLDDSLTLNYVETPFVSGSQNVSLYPSEGYHDITLSTKEKLQFYAHPKGSWEALKQRQLIEINTLAMQKQSNEGIESIKIPSEYPYYWWYGLSLLGFGMLWLDERLY